MTKWETNSTTRRMRSATADNAPLIFSTPARRHQEQISNFSRIKVREGCNRARGTSFQLRGANGAGSNHHFQRYLVENVGVGAGGEDIIEIFCSTYTQLILGDLFTPGTQRHKKDPFVRSRTFLPPLCRSPSSSPSQGQFTRRGVSLQPVDISAFFPFLFGHIGIKYGFSRPT